MLVQTSQGQSGSAHVVVLGNEKGGSGKSTAALHVLTASTNCTNWTAWKYAMHDAGCRMPTQCASGVARCFCGATMDIQGTATHVYAAHMMAPHHA
jgi:ATPase MipZ